MSRQTGQAHSVDRAAILAVVRPDLPVHRARRSCSDRSCCDQVGAPRPASARPAQADPRNATLTVAYSPEKAALMQDAGRQVQRARSQRTPDGQAMRIELVEVTPEEMVNQALAGRRRLPGDDARLVAVARPAEPALGRRPGAPSEPGAIAAAPDRRAGALRDHPHRHRGLGGRGPVARLARHAGELADAPGNARRGTRTSRWSHPSTAYASGLLATLAEFYAGAGVQRGLTAADGAGPEDARLRPATSRRP